MCRDVSLRIKLERNRGIDRGFLAVRMKMCAEIELRTRFDNDARVFFKFMTVVPNAIRLEIRLTALRIHGRRAGVMKRFKAFDSLDLDSLHITIFGHAQIDGNIRPYVR